MRQFLLTLCLFLLIAATPATVVAAEEDVTLEVGDYFSPFAGTTTDGEEFDLKDHYNAGMYIFIDFWATWCAPCKRSMPDVVAIWDEYGGERLLVTGVNMDVSSTEERMHTYMEEAAITFPCVTELNGWDTSISKERGIHYIPQNYLLAPDGTILFKDLHGDDLRETVKSLLERPEVYSPILMSIEVDDDPRDEEEWCGRAEAGEAGVYVNPFAPPLNVAPKKLNLRLKVINPEEEHFRAVLSYDLHKPTGRRTYLIRDQETKAVYRHRVTGEPFIFYEIEVEEKEVIFEGSDGLIDTGFTLPLGDDVWEVTWELRVFSIFLNREVHGADDYIDFAGYYTVKTDTIEEQGGIVYGKDALEES
jgi:thiol-disulfide isomerase/thioredoxin